MSTVMVFDFGLQRTGVAVGNTIVGTASAVETLQSINNKPNWDGISRLIEQWAPSQLVVGMPKQLDGQDTPLTAPIEKFCNQLNGRYNLPVAQANEQFTSIEAGRRLKEVRQAGRKRKVKKEEVDQISAVIIFENWYQNQ
ncbi:Holliday junction resolvase RuvX [Leucothrix pacifica]|uniref:Putative pre-16S rRNA nuclease n=1 Tax=Leucothrix pacifica TaxID=1247513 RepID=A0A317C6N7_9GAMM|nr:Holliday junction resolvase RuvX [Leucothrix pacifica]PWQ93073.1 Holliday junction resolvase RuvX [Leucothrix pacifica]